MKFMKPRFSKGALYGGRGPLLFLVISALLFIFGQSLDEVVKPASAQSLEVDEKVVDENFDLQTGYRIRRYQAAVPQSPPAGSRVWIPQIDRLVGEEHALLLDVSPITGAGYDPQTGVWRSSKVHKSLPGAIWLPEVGRGTIDNLVARFFSDNLARITNGNMERPLIVFCHADCWMSWNAIKRADQLGYKRLYWFPEGADGWRDWDRELVSVLPTPIDVKALN